MAAFTTCADWPTQCRITPYPNSCGITLTPLCYNPVPGQVCAGSLAGTLVATTVEQGLADSVCQEFFKTNSTPSATDKGAVLLKTSTAVPIATGAAAATTTKAASSAFSVAPAVLLGGDANCLENAAVAGAAPAVPTPNNLLKYYTGPVIGNIVVNPIFYGANTYYQNEIVAFLKFLTNSTYMDTLAAYSVPAQKIGRGSYNRSYVETANIKSSLNDVKDIQPYLLNLVKSGIIFPTPNTYFPIFLNPTTSVTQAGGWSCVDFCGYHGSINIQSFNIPGTPYLYYGVHPDQTGDCYGGCGDNDDPLANLQSVVSHELAESVTNPAVGQNPYLKFPIAWYAKSGGEIGDICNAMQDQLSDGKGNTFTVQKLWSNLWGGVRIL
ncbi:hypothetical protein HDU99_002734 [Rhizoclosmatium hyalinum]|nr:hypothetical protein HDU99_002734 [Rhizoclosmatium hyalinum]